MNCLFEFMKWTLFLFNLMFSLCGIAIITVGGLSVAKIVPTNDILDANNMKYSAITLIVIGSIIFVIAFFGCCGAIRESHCMSITFAIFLLTILVIQVAIAIYLIVFIKDFNEAKVTEEFQEAFNHRNDDKDKNDGFQSVQEIFACCGVRGPQDWSGKIPGSCCGKSHKDICSADNAYQEGCAKKSFEIITKAGKILGGIVIGFGVVEVCGIVFSLCLASSIKNKHRRGYEV